VGKGQPKENNREPRLIDLRWNPQSQDQTSHANPFKLTLVGKGVCFDSGGLNLKTPSGMQLMKNSP